MVRHVFFLMLSVKEIKKKKKPKTISLSQRGREPVLRVGGHFRIHFSTRYRGCGGWKRPHCFLWLAITVQGRAVSSLAACVCSGSESRPAWTCNLELRPTNFKSIGAASSGYELTMIGNHKQRHAQVDHRLSCAEVFHCLAHRPPLESYRTATPCDATRYVLSLTSQVSWDSTLGFHLRRTRVGRGSRSNHW